MQKARKKTSFVPRAVFRAAVQSARVVPVVTGAALASLGAGCGVAEQCFHDCPGSGGTSGTGVVEDGHAPRDAVTMPIDTGAQPPDVAIPDVMGLSDAGGDGPVGEGGLDAPGDVAEASSSGG
jgi:hypothetical protein